MSESMSPSSTADDVEVITPAPEEALPNIDDIEESAIVKEDVVKDGEDDEDPFANHENLPESPFKGRPLGWNSALEQSVYYYAPNPLMFSVIFLLTLMVLDRTVMWGTTYTNVPFLTGFYNGSWNPNMGASQAAMFSSSAMIVAYITPFFTALLADGLFGDFSTILILMVLFSLPGLILMVLAAWPELLGSEFNKDIMRVGMLILYPIGNGGMNTLNDMFSAKQYHPVSQKAEVEKYFVWSGVASVTAGLIAQLLVTTVASFNYVASVMLMAVFQFLGIVVFLAARKRYVRRTTDRFKVINFIKAIFLCCLPCKRKKREEGEERRSSYVAAAPGPGNLRQTRGGILPDKFVDGFIRLLWIIPFQLLGLPSNVCMFAFMNLSITQSFAMASPSEYWGGPQMLCFGSISAMLYGQLLVRKIIPWMHSKGYYFPVVHKLATAGIFYFISFILYTVIDLQIHRVWNEKQEQISIWWQVFPLIPVGVAVIQTVPTLDGFVFNLAPTEFKTLGNAINKLVQVALSNQVVKSLYRVCGPWFENKTGDNPSNISSTEYYVEAQVWKFFLVMAGWGLLLVLLGFFPPMKWWTDFMEGLSDPEKYKKGAKDEDDNGSSSEQSAPNRRATMESDEQQVVADELRNEAEPESEQ